MRLVLQDCTSSAQPPLARVQLLLQIGCPASVGVCLLDNLNECVVLRKRRVVCHEALLLSCALVWEAYVCIAMLSVYLLQCAVQRGGSLLKDLELGMQGFEGEEVLAPFVHIHL